MVQFVKDGKLLEEELMAAQRLSARCGLRMTLVTLELPHWDVIQKRDRLLGASLTGEKDAIDALNYTPEQEIELITKLKAAARDEADRYAKEMRVCAPLLTTTVKPEGTLSQVCGGVSSGLHMSHSPYYIRRIRITATDPLVNAVRELGWTIHPEVGTPGATREEQLANARILVIDFPVKCESKRTKDEVGVKEQMETYFNFQKHYTEHNSSNTITVRPHEWKGLQDMIWKGWDDFVGVSFLQLDGGSYALTPYEACTREVYEELKSKMRPLTMDLLTKHEQAYVHSKAQSPSLSSSDLISSTNNEFNVNDAPSDISSADAECVGGVCPLR